MQFLSKLTLGILLTFVFFNSTAQQKLQSTKLLQGTGIEEIYQVIPYQDGYICLGMKGDEAQTKKLWMLKLNQQLKIEDSHIIQMESLSDPFKVLTLPNGNIWVLAQHQILGEDDYSVLICLGEKGEIQWTKKLEQAGRAHVLDMILNSSNEILFTGNLIHAADGNDLHDELLLMKATIQGDILWQKTIAFDQYQLVPKSIMEDKQHHIIVTGTGLELKEKTFQRQWVCFQFDQNGHLKNRLIADGYASYSFANSIVETTNGYLAILNHKDYFGKPAIVTLNQQLDILKSQTLNGAPVLLSGVMEHEGQFVLPAVFSNSIEAYSPGFIMMNSQGEIIQSKTSPSLFKHFFITNMQSLVKNQFMLSGIGYHQDQASDVYLMPFSADGKSLCDMQPIDIQEVLCDIKTVPIVQIRSQSAQVSSSDIYLHSSTTAYDLTNICTSPDEEVVDPKDNQNWTQWKDRHESLFAAKIPSEWIVASPIPARQKLTITYKGMANEGGLAVSISTVSGHVVYQNKIYNQDIFDIDVNEMKAGVYYLKVKDDVKEKTIKFIHE